MNLEKCRVPELPEVEVVRAGLAPLFTEATVLGVDVRDGRALKRHRALSEAGPNLPGHGKTLDAVTQTLRSADFETRLTGRSLSSIQRRGKFLWAPLSDSNGRHRQEALVMHLGMSGQLLIRSHDAPDDRNVRARIRVDAAAQPDVRVDFVDQRLFGSLSLDPLITDPHALSTDTAMLIPESAKHIAPDPLEKSFDDSAWILSVKQKSAAIKTILMNQGSMSGVGNIYADEALWAAKIHPQTPGYRISAVRLGELLTHIRQVFYRALAEGGTSFDVQYVNVNGQAGYFAHSLNAYGRENELCWRCDTPIKRVPFGGRSSHFCPHCQKRR